MVTESVFNPAGYVCDGYKDESVGKQREEDIQITFN